MAKKSKQFVDPYAAREAGKYDNPIPSREYILDFLKKCGHLVKRDELNQRLGLSDPERQEALRRRLRAMERDGQIVLTRREGYGLPDKMNLVRGRVIGHRDGFGFLVPDDGSDDLYLSARQMQLVFHGDRVLARVIGLDRRNRREGVIAEVLERNTPSLVGRFFKEKGVAFVVPSNNRITQDILIGVDDESAAISGQIVVVEITRFPSFRQQAIGRITEILGEHMAPGLEIEIAIRNYNLPHVWPDSVQEEITALQAGVLPSDEQADRVDLQDIAFVTIDGADAKDFDDAVYCERQKKQWRLVVAIADVSHYISPQSELDKEAEARGNSVYFPNSVLPMLPEVLSNELCSLKPKVNRLCMVCDMLISSKGELKRFQFYPAVIHSRARLIYNDVAAWLTNNKCPPAYKNLLPHLQNLHSLYQLLRQTREARGAIDFETTETQVIFGPDRKIKQIIPSVRTVAHRIIEECMLLANVSAAHFLLKAKIPTLFRDHAAPAAEKLADLKSFLAELGLRFPNKKTVTPEDYSSLLKLIADRPDAHLIQTVMLRSLSQAIYSPENIGHFGLAFDAYAHFTSPIRRYPDLLVHRAIRHVLAKRKAKDFFYDKVTISRLGEHCSTTERRADEATREVLDWLKCEYMRDRVGETFDGIITNVTGFGLFVELRNIYVEGLVHVTALHNDYYQFDANRHCLQGERTGIVYRLGDRIQVRVGRVDLDQRKIDFELLEPEIQKPTKKAKNYKKRK
ncbi:MAG: ribonuclease [Pseudomonadota bacterium]|jgi:ribonuclease R